MAQKSLYQRRVDMPAKSMTEAGEVLTESSSIAAPAVILAKAPTGLTVGTVAIARSASTPYCYVNLSWTDPGFEYVLSYVVEYSKSASFTNPIRLKANGESCAVECDTSTTYYFRVAAQYPNVLSAWTAAVSTTTPADTTVPPDITDLAASFSNGNLYITWTEPAGEVFRDARIRIYNVGKSTLYGTYYSATGNYTWAASTNLALTSGAGVTSVVVQVTSRSWGSVFGSEVETGTITSTAPSTPTGLTTSWYADTGRASADCTISWNSQSLIKDYVLTVDSVEYITTDNKFVYTHSLNKQQHGSSSGYTELSISLKARNNLLQVSTSAASTSAINAQPPDATSVSLTGYFSSLAVSVTEPTPLVQDLDKFEFIVYNNDVQQSTLTSSIGNVRIPVSDSGVYKVGVKIYDVFTQASNEVQSDTVIVDAISIAQLRSEASYTDSAGNTPATLAVLKDGTLTGSSVSYTASADWRWVLLERPLLDRYKTITLALSATGTTYFYVGYSSDNVTYTYYYGTITDGRTLPSSTATEATAQASPAQWSQLTANRIDISALKEARYIKLGLKNTTNTITLYEFYARRLVQSDDIEAESIKAINIGASQVTADKISVATLSAIKADMGTLTAGSIVIGTTNKLWLNDSSDGSLAIGGTDKASAPFRVTAAGALTATNATLTGSLSAGSVYVSSDGVRITVPALSYGGTEPDTPVYTVSRTYSFRTSHLGGYDDAGGIYQHTYVSYPLGAGLNCIYIEPKNQTSVQDPDYGLDVNVTTTFIRLISDAVRVDGGLAVGSAASTGTGVIKASSSIYSGGSIYPSGSTNLRLQCKTITNLANDSGAILLNDEDGNGTFGPVWVGNASDAYIGQFFLRGGGHVVHEIADPDNKFSTTSGTAGMTNIYWYPTGTTYLLQNKTGGTKTYYVWYFSN